MTFSRIFVGFPARFAMKPGTITSPVAVYMLGTLHRKASTTCSTIVPYAEK